MRRATIVGALVVTAIEAPAVYAFLRLEEDHLLIAVLCLVVGETLETGLSSVAVQRRLQRYRFADPPHEPGAAQRHNRRFGAVFIAMSLAEVGLWVAWLRVDDRFGFGAGFLFLLVLMHLKHQAETATVRGVVFSTGLFGWRLTLASLFEVCGAAGALWLLEHDREVLAAGALAAGLLFEHLLLIYALLREIAQRDIRLPRVPGARRPAPDFLSRMAEYWGGNLPWWWRFVNWFGPLRIFFNWLAINQLIGRAPYRPEPLSLMAPYTSWASLTDKTWSGRHLPPAADAPAPPPVDDVAALFRREQEMTPCPKSTLLFTCFAQWFVDGFLRTQRDDPQTDTKRDTRRNESTHNIDLNTVYGLTAEMTDQLRSHEHGRLKRQWINGEEYPPDLCCWGIPKREFDKLLPVFAFKDMTWTQRRYVFAMGSDTRNLGFVSFNVLFLREHNRIARKLESRYPGWDDDRLFGTARAILIVLLIKLVVNEYINHITGYHFKFAVRARRFRRARWQRPNWMAVEFNLLYRWHGLVPTTYEFGGYRLTVEQSLAATRELAATGLGAFMEAMSSTPAGRVGLFNTVPFLVERAEKPSIEQGRAAQLRSYNDYRELVGFPRVTRFKQLSSSLRIQQGLEDVYGDVGDVELYTGLFAEEAGPNNVLPPLMTALVAFDAFSQVLTNPLLAPQIYGKQTFSAEGMEIISGTNSISDLVNRNVPVGRDYHVSLTRRDYVRV